MPAPKPRKTLQDILKQRQNATFVGRESQLAHFRQNLENPIDFHHFLFNVWGQGGVGKSTLLRQFCRIAEAKNWGTAFTDETQTTVPAVMGQLAQQLEQQGYKLPQFSDRYTVYRQKIEELEAEPDAPQGVSALIGRSLAKAGLGLVKQVPGSGAFTPFLEEGSIADQAGEWATFVAKKLTNKDEVRLVQNPVEVLTPLFLQGLNLIAEQTGIALFFDTYERTSSFLDGWLRNLIEGRYGDLPATIVITIAGRQELNRNAWSAYESLIVRLPLDPFTETEARQYLSQKNVDNPQVIDMILSLSDGLPVLIELLAFGSPTDPIEMGEASSTAVERLLTWVEDPQQRQVALDAALPRLLNRDVLAQLYDENHANTLWQWLLTMPFLKAQSDGWTYHEIVRSQMLRHLRLTAPQSLATQHGKLATYYNTLRTALELDSPQCYRDRDWQCYSLNFLYHYLCQLPQKHLSPVLNQFLAALKYQPTFAEDIVEIMIQSGKDIDAQAIERMGEDLGNGLKAYEQKQYDIAIQLFTTLLANPEIESQWRPVALAWRGEAYRKIKSYSTALQDLNQAVEQDPQYGWAIASRAEIHSRNRQYEEALQDFNTAIQINPNYDWAIAGQARIYCLMQRYEEAINSYNQAIKLNPQHLWAIAGRGQTYALMQDYENALVNYNQAIELNPESTWAIENRGKLHRLLGNYSAALKDFDRAIALNPRNDWALADRAETYRLMRQYDKAIEDFNHSIEIYDRSAWKFAGRGETYRLMQQYANALQNFEQAIALNPKDGWIIAYRGKTYLALHRYEDALTDFNRAVELKPDNDRHLHSRALAYKALNQPNLAQNDLNYAIQLAQQHYSHDPQDTHNTFNLALYHLTADHPEQAQHFYQDTLSKARQPQIMRAICDLEDLLMVLPEWRSVEWIKDALEKEVKL